MAELVLNPAQQRFVSAILAGKSQVQAYEAYKNGKIDGKTAEQIRLAASKITRSARVGHALARARRAVADRLELQTTDLVEMLLETREMASKCEPPQHNAAVAATMGIGKLLGLVIDRKDVTLHKDKPALLPVKSLELTEEDWKRSFVPKLQKDQG